MATAVVAVTAKDVTAVVAADGIGTVVAAAVAARDIFSGVIRCNCPSLLKQRKTVAYSSRMNAID